MQAVQKRLGPAANYFMKRALNSYVKIHKKVLLDVIKKLDLGGNEGIRAKLIKFIEKQFGETKLNMEDPFASYNESQAKYGTLNKFISVVKKANRRWPQELTDIVNFALDLNGDSFDVRTDVLEALLKLDDAHVFIRPVLDLFATVNFEFSDNDKERLRSGVSYLVQSDNKLGVSHFKMLLSLLLVNLQSEDIILGLRNLCALKLAYGDDLFVALLDLVAEHGLQVLDVAQIKKLLGETDEDKTNANPKIELLKGFLSLFQPDTARLNEALRVINAHASSAMILEIVVRSCLLEKECTAEELFELIGFLQEKDEGFIADLARQYDAKPYPARGRLLVGLRGQDVDVKQFIADYERDPFGTRNDYLVGQFDVTNARRVVNEVNDIKKEKRLSASARRQLLNDFNYINDIGCKPKIRSDGALVKVAVKDFTHEKIVIQMEHCKNVLRNPESSKRDNAKARLEYLALLREVMYRTTGKFPYSTQIITVLNAFMQSGSVLSEVNTGEGKSIVSALNAAMLWVEGQSVDVCSSDLVLSERDFEKFKDFYDYLGIEATFVSASSPSTAYKIGGVNYSDVANLSLFRSRAKITGVRLRTIGESKLPVSLVLDESDAAILDQRTLFNFSMNLDADIDPDINLDAWVYPLIVKFAQSEIFTNVNATVADDISNIRIYLQKNADIQQSRQLENISNEQLDRWLDSACAAQVLCEELDYVVCTEKRDIHGEVKTYSVARVLIGDRPSAQTKWSFGVHQLLHARLNAELAQEQPPFICEPETAYIDSRTSKNFIDYYGRKHGRILGMTGTIGSEAEIKLQHKNYGFSMFKIPPHRVSRRVDLLPKFENDLLGQAQAIRDIVATLDGENPMLVICKDIPSASQMHNELQNSQQLQGYTVQLVDGRQDADVERELIANASQNKTITIATPILGRGTDIIPESEDGLFVVQTFVDTHRATSQIRGRAGRQGEFGKTQEICSVGAMKKAVGSERIFPEYQQLADYLRSDAESLAAVARDRSEQIGEIKRAILWMADKWNIYFLESESEDDQLKNYGKKEALELRRDLNCDLDTSAKGESEQKSLQEFAVRYKKLSSDAWQKVHNKYAAKVAEVMGAEYQLPANLQQDVNSIGKIKPKKTYRKLPAEVVLTEAERIDKEIEVIEMFQKKNPLSRLLLSQIGKGPNVANNRAEMLLHCKPDSKAVAKYFLGSQRRRKDFKYSELLRIYDNYPAANKVIGARDRMLATKLEASILWRQVSKDPEVRKLLGIKPSSYKNVGEKLRGGVSASPVQESVKASSRQVLRDERNARHKQLNSVTTGRPRSSSEVFQVDAVAVKRGAVSKDDEIVPEIGFVCSQ
ncbi:MAG: hypothetical protein KAS93_03285 [Gammaproteobacteria bacterium]|nr:hypothetical protein [Gammaproteobacteria bacterium]